MKPIRVLMIALLNDPVELNKRLMSEPLMIRMQDEDGRTLMHHAVLCVCYHEEEAIVPSWRILLVSPLLDLQIQDNAGNTPLHQGVLTYLRILTRFINGGMNFDFKTKLISHLILPMIDRMCDRMCDCSILNKDGYSPLHIAAITTGTYNPIQAMADVISICEENRVISSVLLRSKNPGLNILSREGASALFYAIQARNFPLANDLLVRGANPCLYQGDKNNPLKKIDEMQEKAQSTLSEMEKEYRVSGVVRNSSYENWKQLYNKFDELREKMKRTATLFKASYNHIGNTAIILGQGRRQGCVFTLFSNDIIVDIASQVGVSPLITKAGAEKIARDALLSIPAKTPTFNKRS